MHLVDIGTVRSYCNISTGIADSLIEILLGFVDTRIPELCNQEIFAATETMQWSGNGYDYKVIPNFPIISITSLKFSSGLPVSGARVWTPVTTNYELVTNKKVSRVYFPAGFLSGPYNYQLIYQYGYVCATANAVPGTVQNVALEMCDILYKNSDIKGLAGSRLGLNSVSLSESLSTSTSFKNMEPGWKKKLGAYTKLING